MKVSLIESKPSGYNGFDRFTIPRLGLPIMAAILKQNGHQASVYVPQLEGLLQHSIEISKSDLIGISTLTPTAPDAYSLARWIRRANRVRTKQIPIVLGGPHVTFLPEEGLAHADFVVRGEGEHTLLELVRALESGGPLSGILGLSYWDGDRMVHNPDRPLEPELDSFPFADMRAIVGHEHMRWLPITTSRGCPHDCDFCSVVPMFGRGYRRRSNESIMRELEESLLPLGNRIFFVDDNFATRRAESKGLLQLMKQRNLGKRMRWYTQVTVHAARDEQLLELMRDTNCTQVYVGFESINPATLRSYNKQQTIEGIRHCIRAFQRKGIRVHGMFVLGSDEDDPHTLEATVEFAKREGINTVQFSILSPLPGTRTYQRLDKRIFTRDWSLYDGFHVVHEPAKMTPYELQKGALDAWGQFYSVPSYIQAFMRLKLTTGMLRLYGRTIVKRARRDLKDYLQKLRPAQLAGS